MPEQPHTPENSPIRPDITVASPAEILQAVMQQAQNQAPSTHADVEPPTEEMTVVSQPTQEIVEPAVNARRRNMRVPMGALAAIASVTAAAGVFMLGDKSDAPISPKHDTMVLIDPPAPHSTKTTTPSVETPKHRSHKSHPAHKAEAHHKTHHVSLAHVAKVAPVVAQPEAPVTPAQTQPPKTIKVQASPKKPVEKQPNQSTKSNEQPAAGGTVYDSGAIKNPGGATYSDAEAATAKTQDLPNETGGSSYKG
jgi:hypothetical protein